MFRQESTREELKPIGEVYFNDLEINKKYWKKFYKVVDITKSEIKLKVNHMRLPSTSYDLRWFDKENVIFYSDVYNYMKEKVEKKLKRKNK